MESKTPLQSARELMDSITTRKEEELARIDQHIKEAAIEDRRADDAIQAAITAADPEEYGKAKAAKARTQAALEMYTARAAQITSKEGYMTEAESDKVIDGLLEYEKDLADAFRRDAAKHLRALSDLYRAYDKEVQAVESTIEEWGYKIRPNYTTRGGTSYYDPSTGTYTDRSPKPVKVHQIPYTGCDEAGVIAQMLEDTSIKQITEGAGE